LVARWRRCAAGAAKRRADERDLPGALRAGEIRKQIVRVYEANFPFSRAANRHDALETRPESFGMDSRSFATAFNLSRSVA
jgi:hypothetical protein